MGKHRDQAKFDRAGWRLRVLLPCWITQTSMILVLIGISAYLLSNAVKDSDEIRVTAIAWQCINIGVGVLGVALTAYEIFRTVTETLTPRAMVVTSLVKLFGVVLCLIMDGLVTGSSLNAWAEGMFVIHSVLIIAIVFLGSCAAWKWKRLAQYDDYHLPGNVNPYGFRSDAKKKGVKGHTRFLSEDLDWDPELEMGNTVEIRGNASTPGVLTPSSSDEAAPGDESAEPLTRARRGSSFTNLGGRKTFSMGYDDLGRSAADGGDNDQDHEGSDVDGSSNGNIRSRANSASALLMAPSASYDPAGDPMLPAEPEPARPPRPASYISVTGTGHARRASYNHARDTAFDEYVAQQKQKRRVSQRMSLINDSALSLPIPSSSTTTTTTTITTTTATATATESSSSLPSSSSTPVPAAPATSSSSSSSNNNNRNSVISLTENQDAPPLTRDRADSASRYRLSLHLKSDIDDALGAEFGWGTASRSSSQDSIMVAGHPPAIAVGGGSVPGTRSVRDSIGRAPSDGSERGALGIVPERPEDDDDHDHDEEGDRHGRVRSVSEAGRSLLGGADRDHPEALRPGRPKSEAFAFVITPPPRSPSSSGGARGTWGSAYARKS